MKTRKAITVMVMWMMAFMVFGAMPVQSQEYAYTQVIVTIAQSKSFSVTLNGQAATNSNPTFPGTATQVIWFNGTTGNEQAVNATVAGASAQVGPWPACTTPIEVFKNTGNVNLRFNVFQNNTIACTTFMYNASMAAGSTTGTANATLGVIDAAGSAFVSGLGMNNQTNLCIWSNFSACGGGSYYTTFNYTSN